MGEITLVTGGARSGKSAFAESTAEHSHAVVYVATAQPCDEEMAERIARHRHRRPTHWRTLESPLNLWRDIKTVSGDTELVLVDCIAVWCANRLLTLGEEITREWWRKCESLEAELLGEIREGMKYTRGMSWEMVIVTNEVGFGVVPPTPMGRAYRDMLGRINQLLAQEADQVIMLVAGIPLYIKGKRGL
jgi:adenosylcobinamide kinase/adenosylcobinamide-phosphate guanylyltransferase